MPTPTTMKKLLLLSAILIPGLVFGQFGNLQDISHTPAFVEDLTTSDLDGDGDLDIITASKYDDKIVWDGNGNFGDQ